MLKFCISHSSAAASRHEISSRKLSVRAFLPQDQRTRRQFRLAVGRACEDCLWLDGASPYLGQRFAGAPYAILPV
jgi:hypothetical protein